jgi:hypothetical protein
MNNADEREIEHHFARVASLADEWEVCAEGCTVVTVVATALVMLRKRIPRLNSTNQEWALAQLRSLPRELLGRPN